VYLAKVMHADGFSRLAAIKLLHQRWSENVEIAQRMRDEARLLGWLRHRNIVDVIDLTTIGGRVAVIMEYLEGIDFKGAINHIEDTGSRMPPRAALEATAFVASALDAAYNRPPYQGEKPLRVIHRDIKPSNIMVDESGTVKVLDFGVARADFDHRESHTQELQFGSVDYMPPERLFFEPETPFSDVYSLGSTLYELLALEKLGKAKGRPEKHAQFLVDRMDFLRTRCDLPGAAGDATIEFVRAMCAYNHEGRPSAAEVVTRCRALARGFEGEGLTEWAERLIPPLVKAIREAPREPNPLTDSILSEDSASFKAEDTYVEAVEGGVVLRAEDPVPAAIPKSDARMQQLRDAARSEILADPRSNFADGPTSVGHVDDEVEVIDEGADATAVAPAVEPPRPPPASLGPSRTILPPAAMDAPSAPYVKKAVVPSVVPPLPEPGTRPQPSRGAPGPTATIIPDDDFEEARTALRSSEPVENFGEEATVVAPPADPEVRAPRASPDVTVPGVPAGTHPPAPREPARQASALDDDEPAPPKRGWILPVVLLLAMMVVGGGLVAVVIGSAFLSSGGDTVVVEPLKPDIEKPEAPTDPVQVAGGINFVSAAPDTTKMTVTCDGVEQSGAEKVGVASPTAKVCSVKVILGDRSRLYAELTDVQAGTWRCFEGGSKECVR
jgi:serine/threonine protein kinase